MVAVEPTLRSGSRWKGDLTLVSRLLFTAQKMNVSKCQSSNLPIGSHLLKKSLMENFIFCAVIVGFNFGVITYFDPIMAL